LSSIFRSANFSDDYEIEYIVKYPYNFYDNYYRKNETGWKEIEIHDNGSTSYRTQLIDIGFLATLEAIYPNFSELKEKRDRGLSLSKEELKYVKDNESMLHEMIDTYANKAFEVYVRLYDYKTDARDYYVFSKSGNQW
jgi:hypothetical protein